MKPPQASMILRAVRRALRSRTALAMSLLLIGASSVRSQQLALPRRSDLPVLMRAQQVRGLTPEQASLGYPVHLRAVVTYFDPSRADMFVQDSTAGIWVDLTNTEQTTAPGDLVDLRGASAAPDFAPQVSNPRWAVLGRAPMPAARRVSFQRMASTSEDSQWVEVEGIVRSAKENEGELDLTVVMEDGRLTSIIPGARESEGRNLVDAKVRVRGACGAVFNEKRQLTGVLLYVPSLAEVHVEEPAPADPFGVQVRTIGSLLQFSTQEVLNHRVRLRGVVTLPRPGVGAYIQDQTGGLYAQSDEENLPAPGDLVDVLGFPALGGNAPILQDAVFRKTGAAPQPAPVKVTAAKALTGNFDAQLVRIEGKLLDRTRVTGEQVLVLQEGSAVFTALLTESRPDSRLAAVPVGSRLQLTGVCVTPPDPNRVAASFRIYLRSGQDVVVLERPSWLTVSRALSLAGLMGIAIVLALAWVVALRQRVAAQTGVFLDRLDKIGRLEARYRRLFEHNLVGVRVSTLDGQFLDCNLAFAHLLGFDTPQEVLLHNAKEFYLRVEDREALMARLLECGRVSNFEIRMRRRDGTPVWVLENLILADGEKGPVVEGTLVDISERKRAEEELREYEKVVEGLQEMIVVVDRDYRYLIANRAYLDYRGLEREQVVGCLLSESLEKEVFEQTVKKKLDECFQGKVVRYELRYKYPKLGERDLFISYFPIEGPFGVDRVACVLQDVTDRKRAEQALLLSEEKFAKAFRSSPNAMAISTLEEGRFLEVNDSFLRQSGHRREDVVGRTALELGVWVNPDDRVRVIDELRKSGRVNGREVLLRSRSGQIRVTLFSGETIEVRGVHCLLTVAEDITERKRAEEELRESEKRWRAVFENSAVGIALTDRHGKFLSSNRAYQEMMGYTDEELRALSFLDVTYEEDREINRALAIELREGKRQQFQVEKRNRRKDGNLIWVRATISAALDAEGEFRFAMGIIEEITERKQAEEALKFTRFSLNNAADTMVCVGRDGRFIDVNDAFCRSSGYSREELLSMTVHDIDPDYSAEIWPEFWEKLKQSGSLTFESCHRTKGGKVFPVEITATFFEYKGKECHCSFARDITERKRAEEALRRSESNYHNLVQTAHDVIWSVDAEGRITFMSPAAERIYGYKPEGMIGHLFTDFVPPEWRQRELEEASRLKEGGKSIQFENVLTRTDGSLVYLSSNAIALRDGEGKVIGSMGASTDITERKRAEEVLRESEKLYRLLAENVTDVIWTSDLDLRYTYISPSVMRLRGVTVEEAMAEKIEETLTPSSLKVAKGAFAEELSKESIPQEDHFRSRTLELEQTCKDGSTVWTEVRATVLRDSGGRPVGILGVTRDISARQRAERALRESEKYYRSLFDNMLNALAYLKFHFDQGRPVDFTYLDVNKAFETQTGFKNLVGKRASEVLPGLRQSDPGLFERYGRVALTGEPDRFETYVEAIGCWHSVSVYSPQKEYVVVVFDDITERKRAGEQLRYQAALLASVNDAVVASDAQYRLTAWNEAAESVYGWKAEEVLGRNGLEMLRTEWLGVDAGRMRRSIAETGRWRGEVTQTRKDGTRIPVEVSSVALRDESGQITGYVSVNRDITERKRAEEALELAAKRFHLVTLATQDAVFDWDLVTHEIWRNENYRRLFGAPEKSLDSENWWADRLHPEDRDRAVVALDAALGSEASLFSAEYRLRCPDGSYAHIIDRAYIVRNAPGQPVRMIGALSDITERRHAEKALRESEQRYRLLFQRNQAGVSLATADGMVDCNEALALMFGYESREDMLSQEVRNFYFDPAQRRVIAEKLAKGERLSGVEMCCRKKDGTPVWVLFSISLVLEEGEAPMVQVTVIDITGRKRAEEALVEGRHLLHTLLDNLPDYIYFKDRQSCFLRANLALTKAFGLSNPAQVVGKTDFDFFTDEHAQQAFADEQEIIRTRQPMVAKEEKETWPDGHVTWVSTTKMPLRDAHGSIIGTFGISHDVTERKHAEKALRESEQRYRLLFERNQAGVSLATLDGMVDCNEALASMFGYESREDMLSQDVRNFYFDPADRRVMAEKMEKERRISGFELCCRKKDGTPVWVLFSVSLVLEEGEAPMVQVTVIDITGRKRAEEALIEERYLLHTLVDNLPDAIYFKDRESRFTRISKADAKRFGLSEPAQAIGKTDFDFFTDEHARQAFADEQEIIRTGQPMLAKEEKETWPDGHVTWVSTTKMPLRDAHGNITGTFGISHDVTERKRAEEGMQRSFAQLRALAARLQSVREEERTRVAREIHDELGQALTAIKIDLSSLIHGLPADKKQQSVSILKLVDETIQSLRRISAELRPAILDAVGLVAAVEWAAGEFAARAGIECRLDLPPDDVLIDQERATALFRIFQETLTNVARHANATEVKVRLAKAHGTLTLEVNDNGKGAGEEQLSAGNSLGILGMRERALLLGGELTITGTRGKGTTVKVRIPETHPTAPEDGK